MTVRQLLPDLWMISTGFPQVYLWRDGAALTMIDAGFPGDGPALAAEVESLGFSTSAVRRLVLTHHHEDHTGAAAEVRGWGDVEVIAHRHDASIVRGDEQPPPRTLSDEERALFERLSADIPPAPPCRVDTEVTEGDTIDFGGGALVVSGAGHTAGSIALLVTGGRVLFTGDLIVRMPGGLSLGLFNDDRARAARSAASLTELDVDLLCPGHGDPLADAAAWAAFGRTMRSIVE